jgi:hypothetical protein
VSSRVASLVLLVLALGRPRPALADASGVLWGGTGETVFEHRRADLRDPHFGMRLYPDHAVPGTLHGIPDPDAPGADARAGAPDGRHLFWDVALGERAPVVGWYNGAGSRSSRYARGVVLNLDAAAFVLLDFSAQSAAVINSDYRFGASVDFRPWSDAWDWLSLSLGYYHQSTHLADEYVLSAATIQGQGSPPQVNALLPYRANPSVEAFPLLASVDVPDGGGPVSLRVYGGSTLFARSELPIGRHAEYRAGAELRWAPERPSAAARPDGRPRRGRRGFELAYELLGQRRYHHVGPEPGPPLFEKEAGYWSTHHAVLMYAHNLDLERSSSNALAVGLELLWGRLQHGQLIEYATTKTGALSLAYYW